MFGHRLHLDRVAQIRLVGAVFAHCLGVRNAREGFRHRFAAGKGFDRLTQHAFHRRQHIVLFDKAHFQIELVEFPRQPVGARVFVAKTGRDLEIAVEARHHDQLLELLRRLRQGVELARMDAARHEEIARALRARCGEDRCREFGKSGLVHAGAHVGNDRRALHDIGVQGFAPQVEKAVFQADVFGVIQFAEHRQRQLLRSGEHLHLADEDFDLAGRQVGIDRIPVAQLDLAINADHPFGANRLGQAEGGRIGVGHHLGDAIVIAQVDKQHAAVVADAMHPSGQPGRLTGVGGSQLITFVAAVGMHGL